MEKSNQIMSKAENKDDITSSFKAAHCTFVNLTWRKLYFTLHIGLSSGSRLRTDKVCAESLDLLYEIFNCFTQIMGP